jgi:hypothetical protein
MALTVAMSDFQAHPICVPEQHLKLTTLDAATSERLCGGTRQRSQPLPVRSPRNGDAVGRVTKISGAFYQINMAFNFIVGGTNNTITNIQGNGIEAISFKALGWS